MPDQALGPHRYESSWGHHLLDRLPAILFGIAAVVAAAQAGPLGISLVVMALLRHKKAATIQDSARSGLRADD